MPQLSDARMTSHLRLGGWGMVAALLLLPLIAMQFTSQVNWGAGDFLAAAILLGCAGLALEAMVLLVRNTAARVAIGLAILAAVATVWAELAVGLF